MNAKITFPELVDMVAEATSSNRRVSELFLKELFATISQAVIDGENVTVRGLGTFKLARVAARNIVSVNTGMRTQVPGHNKLVFEPDKKLAEELNQPFAQFETIELDDSITDDMLGDSGIADAEQPSAAEPDVVASQDGEPVETPPPFRPAPALQTPAPDIAAQPIHEVAPEPEPESEEPVEESLGQEPAQESEPFAEPEVSPRDFTLAELAHEQQTAVRRATLRGIMAGALGMLLLCVGAWWTLAQRHGQAEPAQVLPDTTMIDTPAADTARMAAPAAVPVVTDTVSATNYLTRMAVKHYGKQDFWVYIYEENKDKISNPNAVPPGTVLVIPPASKYGIDPGDRQSVDAAKKKSYELFSQFN